MKKDSLSTILNIFHYYYFVLAIVNITFIILDLPKIYNITTIIILISMTVEALFGYIRGFLGIFGYIISILICYYLTENAWISLSLGISILHIIYILIYEIFIKIIKFIDKKTIKK